MDEEKDIKEPANKIAEVSHELRLPIANIRLLVETLLDGAMNEPETCRRMLKRTYQEVDRLQNLVTDLLSLEKNPDGKQDKRFAWINLYERATYAADTLAVKARDGEVELELKIEPKCLIWAIPEQLDQVLLNLLENSIKFTKPGGRVEICSNGKPGSFSVKDTGIGMPEAEIPKIFSRFYRVDKGSSRRGTGLGLSIVKQVIELHGAKIDVNSIEGKGSTFTLEFPDPRAEKK